MGKTGAAPSHLHRRIYPHGSPRQDPHFSTPERRTRRGSDPYPPEAHLAGGADRARTPRVARSSPDLWRTRCGEQPRKGTGPLPLRAPRLPKTAAARSLLSPAPSGRQSPRGRERLRDEAGGGAGEERVERQEAGGGAEERVEREGAGGGGESVRAGVERSGALLDLGTRRRRRVGEERTARSEREREGRRTTSWAGG